VARNNLEAVKKQLNSNSSVIRRDGSIDEEMERLRRELGE
jgi:hypothetical protein